jgi:hypothetical protein
MIAEAFDLYFVIIWSAPRYFGMGGLESEKLCKEKGTKIS